MKSKTKTKKKLSHRKDLILACDLFAASIETQTMPAINSPLHQLLCKLVNESGWIPKRERMKLPPTFQPSPSIAVRFAISKALKINYSDLSCFTVTDHDGQPMIITLHDGPHKGVHSEHRCRPTFSKLIDPPPAWAANNPCSVTSPAGSSSPWPPPSPCGSWPTAPCPSSTTSPITSCSDHDLDVTLNPGYLAHQ